MAKRDFFEVFNDLFKNYTEMQMKQYIYIH